MAGRLLSSRVMRLVIPVSQGRIAPVFDVAGRFLVVEVIGGEASFTDEVAVQRADRTAEVIGLGAGVLICGAISRDLEERLLANGVEVVAEVRGPIGEVVHAYLEGGLMQPRYSMPGAHGRRRRPRGSVAHELPDLGDAPTELGSRRA